MNQVKRISDEMIPEYVRIMKDSFGRKELSSATLRKIRWHYLRKEYAKSIAVIMKQMNLQFKFHLIIEPEECTRGKMERLIRQKTKTIWPQLQSSLNGSVYKNEDDYKNTSAQILIPHGIPPFHDPRFKHSEVIIIIRQIIIAGSFEIFCTSVAHEIAHVLLSAVKHPVEDQEIAADIIPMLFGFLIMSIIERKFKSNSMGYLTDDQIYMVCENLLPPVEIIYL